MFYSNSSGSDPLNMSKSDMLRGIITEKLSTAAREILAVVERTVTDYEKEASAFRQEIDRQRRQLELLQPQVKLHREDVEAAERHRLMGNHPDDDEDDDDDEEDPVAISKWIQEDLKDPDYETSSRSGYSKVQTGRKRSGGARISDPRAHLILRIWLLEDTGTKVLPESVFRKSPDSILKCARGLQEMVFLDMLRSTFPQLAAGEPFDIFIADKSRSLKPLAVKTPEEICRAGNQNLYVCLKKMQTNTEVREPLMGNSTPTNLVLKNEESWFHSSSWVEGADGSFSSTSQQQEQEADQSNAVSLETQTLWSEVVKTEVKEEECSVVTLTVDPVLTENYESGLPIIFVEDASGSGGDHQSFSSKSDPDDLETDKDDDSDSSTDTDVALNEDVSCNQGVEPQIYGRNNRLTCRVCGMWYRQHGSLISHVWKHVYEPHGVCGACGEKFVSVERLKEHLRSHKKGYSCWHCGKYLLSSTTLNRHVAKHLAGSPITCKVCRKTFSTMSGLNGHSWVHLQKRPVRCHLCSEWFGRKSDLLAHRKLHARGGKHHSKASTGCQGYSCKVCGKTFTLKVTLRKHEKTHTARGRPSATFRTKQNRKNHTQTYSSDGSIVCKLCNMSFVSQETLKVHMIVHSGGSLYKCFECGRCFSRAVYLKNHMKTHSCIQRCLCAICGQVTDRPEALEVHMRIHNRENTLGQNLHPDPRCENTQEKPDGNCSDPSLMSEGQKS
ncbi:zinc finger protein-like isoform X1 [Girardinichthys multiradiatus]|uniref:zinc finger protein-like isoform X1 n=1 Tax=Girardinichthys multiradiatus TaxID=208333 RepID=UPI001FAC15DF|nr:zinc finger protein-like isoform X1 [Girardinichthys multiradiatus]